MKIFIVSNTSWNIYNFRKDLINRLIQDDHQVKICAPIDRYTADLRRLKMVSFIPWRISSYSTNPIRESITLLQALYFCVRFNPDFVLAFTLKANFYFGIVCRLLGIKIIQNISGRGEIFIRNERNLNKFFLHLLRYSYVNSFAHLYQNKSDLSFFASKMLSPNRALLVPGSGVNVSEFNSGLRSGDIRTVLFAGRLIKSKGINEFVEAARRVGVLYPGLIFLVAGDVPKGHSEGYVINQRVNSNIIFLGNVENMAGLFNSVDLFVQPSYGEGLSKVLLEAASSYLPLIASDVQGCREIVRENNGLLCEPRSADSLQNAILKMLSFDANRIKHMGQCSRLIVEENFTYEHVYEVYRNLLDI